ncbi:restriction endonuclease subunit S, partial [Falsiroseomonas sp.]|uniref:restriction endonuclease subunit S n=1 Tax=Falsiroseomonas sp. TaxID=2870721 RepID=UPI00356B452D
MSADRTAALADFCTIFQGGRHKLSGNDFVPAGFPAYGADGMNGYLPMREFSQPAIVLSSIGARCGKCFHADGEWTSLANTQIILPDSERADTRFLWHQLNDEGRWPRSGTAQPFIKPSDVKAHRVFLPPLAEQRRIAAILDEADALRANRRAALAQLDEMARAIFVEMFGDPATNPKDHSIVPLKRIGRLDRGV